VWTVDEHGHDIEERYYDERGNLVLSDGRAVVKIIWDIRANLVEVSYYGPNLKRVRRLSGQPLDPTLSAEIKRRFGIARAAYRYDNRNQKVLEEFFGIDDKPTDNIYGAARVEFMYDSSGKPTEKWISVRGSVVPPKNLEPPPS
jgi:hypothetical protein